MHLEDAQVGTHKPTLTQVHTETHTLKLETATIHVTVGLPNAHVSQAVRPHGLPEKEGKSQSLLDGSR